MFIQIMEGVVQNLVSGQPQVISLPEISSRAKVQMNARGMNFGVITSPAEHAGKIVIRRKIESLDKHDRPTIKTTWQVVSDIYAAVRREEYIMMAFGRRMDRGERRKITNALRQTQLLHETVLGFVDGVQPDEVRKLSEKIIEETAASIGHPRVITKKNVLKQLAALRNGTDSLGRVNLSAMVARTLSVWDNLDKRLRDMTRMDGYISARERNFVQLIQMAELYLDSLRHFINRVLERLNSSDSIEPATCRQIRNQCLRYAAIIECLNVNPYRSMSRFVASDLKEAAEAIRQFREKREDNLPAQSMIDQVRRLLQKCDAALQIRSVAIELHRIVYSITMRQLYGPERILSIKRIKKRVAAITQLLRRINETDFEEKVCHASLAYLKEANQLLQRTVDLSDLEPLRRTIKSAAEAL